MIVAADRFGIHEIDAAFLAGVYHVLFFVEIEDGGSHLHIEVALPQPLGVGWAVVVG